MHITLVMDAYACIYIRRTILYILYGGRQAGQQAYMEAGRQAGRRAGRHAAQAEDNNNKQCYIIIMAIILKIIII